MGCSGQASRLVSNSAFRTVDADRGQWMNSEVGACRHSAFVGQARRKRQSRLETGGSPSSAMSIAAVFRCRRW